VVLTTALLAVLLGLTLETLTLFLAVFLRSARLFFVGAMHFASALRSRFEVSASGSLALAKLLTSCACLFDSGASSHELLLSRLSALAVDDFFSLLNFVTDLVKGVKDVREGRRSEEEGDEP
jgi:hypothetical protein